MTTSRTLSAVSKPNSVRPSGSWTFTYQTSKRQRSSQIAQKEWPAPTGVSMSTPLPSHLPSHSCHSSEKRSAYERSRLIGTPSRPQRVFIGEPAATNRATCSSVSSTTVTGRTRETRPPWT